MDDVAQDIQELDAGKTKTYEKPSVKKSEKLAVVTGAVAVSGGAGTAGGTTI